MTHSLFQYRIEAESVLHVHNDLIQKMLLRFGYRLSCLKCSLIIDAETAILVELSTNSI